MTLQLNSNPIEVDPVAITPDDLLAQLRIELPRERISIKGTVAQLIPYSRNGEPALWVYGLLRGVEGTIRFRCPATNTPTQEGEAIVLTGTIKVEASRFHNGLDVTLHGEPSGYWSPGVNQSENIVRLIKKNTRMSLSTFLKNHSLESLCILASKRGSSDLLAAVQKYDSTHRPALHLCRFNTKQALLSDIKTALSKSSYQGIAFVRGGSDDATLHQWNDAALLSEILELGLPFYTAIGHSDVLLLADKYSDESFTTPTALGDSLGQVITLIHKEKQQQQNLKFLYQEREQLKIGRAHV